VRNARQQAQEIVLALDELNGVGATEYVMRALARAREDAYKRGLADGRAEMEEETLKLWKNVRRYREQAEAAEPVVGAVEAAITLLDRHLGDTDPAEEPDEYEDPVFWAFRKLVDALDAARKEVQP